MNLLQKSDNQLYTDIFWKLLSYIPDETKIEYKFFYDDQLDHLIEDTKAWIQRNMNENLTKEKKCSYKIEVFKRTFAAHAHNKLDKLHHPYKYPEIKRQNRKQKIQKIIETYGN